MTFAISTRDADAKNSYLPVKAMAIHDLVIAVAMAPRIAIVTMKSAIRFDLGHGVWKSTSLSASRALALNVR